MKAQGVVKHIGLSTHSPALANRVLDMGILDMLMFSINPLYDYGQGQFANGSSEERYNLYRRCEKEGVGISVMKPFSAGQLLDRKNSPLRPAMTTAQCIQYALDRPGVVTVLPGPGSVAELEELSYFDAPAGERDYVVVGKLILDDTCGSCVYCKHCRPCPAGLDVGLINKYYDLNRMGDVLAKEHYLTLGKTAADCVQCGHCNSRCPFHVDQMARMREIRQYFGQISGAYLLFLAPSATCILIGWCASLLQYHIKPLIQHINASRKVDISFHISPKDVVQNLRSQTALHFCQRRLSDLYAARKFSVLPDFFF